MKIKSKTIILAKLSIVLCILLIIGEALMIIDFGLSI